MHSHSQRPNLGKLGDARSNHRQSQLGQAIHVTCRKAGYQDTGEFLVATHEPLALLDSSTRCRTWLPKPSTWRQEADAQYPERAQGVAGPRRLQWATSRTRLPACLRLRAHSTGNILARFAVARSDPASSHPDQRAGRLGPRYRNRHNERVVHRSGGSDACRRLFRRGCRQVSTQGR